MIENHSRHLPVHCLLTGFLSFRGTTSCNVKFSSDYDSDSQAYAAKGGGRLGGGRSNAHAPENRCRQEQEIVVRKGSKKNPRPSARALFGEVDVRIDMSIPSDQRWLIADKVV